MNKLLKNQQTIININEKANLIWNIVDIIIGQGLYKPHEYGQSILSSMVIKRFNDTLIFNKQAVLDMYEEIKNFKVKDGFLEKMYNRL